MMETVIGVAVGVDVATSLNAGRLGRNQTAVDPEQEAPELQPGEVTFDRDAVRLAKGVLYTSTIFVCSTMLLFGLLIGL